MNIVAWLLSLPRRPAHRAANAGEARSGAAEPAQEECDRPLGCGWFDSSHELQHGLVVREHPTPDALVAELPLASWLELHLAHWRGGEPT